MSIILDKLCDDTRNYLLSYLQCFDLKNIATASKHCISKLQIKHAMRTFIETHNLIDCGLDKTNYFLQIYYLKSKNVWDYINICSNKDVYLYQKKNCSIINGKGRLIIYNSYSDTCIVQNKTNFR
jgi:hypothetical protein